MRISHSLRAGLATIASLAAFSTPLTAVSQERQSCATDHDALVQTVKGDPYNEELLGAGIASNGNLIELYVNEETGTWTVFASLPTGQTCLVKDGKGWIQYLLPGELS